MWGGQTRCESEGCLANFPATLTVSFAQKQLSRRVSMSHDKPDEPAKSDAQRENEGSSDQRQRAGEREPKHDQQAKHACDYRPGLFKAVAHGAESMCRIDLRRAPPFVATHSCRSIGKRIALTPGELSRPGSGSPNSIAKVRACALQAGQKHAPEHPVRDERVATHPLAPRARLSRAPTGCSRRSDSRSGLGRLE